MKVLSHSVIYEYKLPAGKYIISDPCYVVEDEYWGELLDSCDFFNNPLGKYTRDGKPVHVISFNTAWGDGTYRDNNGRIYGVDAGMIGIMSADDFPDIIENCPEYVHIVNFERDFMVSTGPTRGVMQFGNIIIDTDESDDDYDGYDNE